MDCLEFLYSGKGNLTRIYEVCKSFYRVEKQDQSLINYFMAFKKTYEELNMLLPFSPDVKVQQSQHEKMAIMSFLAGLPSEFESAKSQILSGSEISSLQDVFSRVLRSESPSPPILPLNDVLVSRNNKYSSWRSINLNRNRGADSQNFEPQTLDSGGIVCNYCRKPGHTKLECRKLQYKNQQHSADVMSTNNASNKSVLISTDDFVKFSQFQESLKSSPSINVIADSGKSNACLISSSSKWVINSGATDHMTGNSHLFSAFQSNSSTLTVTLADGSTSRIRGSGTINPTPSLPLSSVLHLPNLSFNLVSVSQLTKNLNCSVSFFPDHCLFQDLTTKKIIGKGHESGGLYILDTSFSTSIACSSVNSAFTDHCRLGHPSLSLFKQICPEYCNVSSLNC